MQDGYGGWAEKMAGCLGKEGIVELVKLDPIRVRVKVGDTSFIWNEEMIELISRGSGGGSGSAVKLRAGQWVFNFLFFFLFFSFLFLSYWLILSFFFFLRFALLLALLDWRGLSERETGELFKNMMGKVANHTEWRQRVERKRGLRGGMALMR